MPSQPPSSMSPPAPKTPPVIVGSDSSPLHLTAIATLAPNSQDGPNTDALTNPMGLPMEIFEIKFRIDMSGLAELGPSPVIFVSGGSIGCRLDYGQVALTNGFVPLFSFCRGYNALDEAGLSTGVAEVRTANFVYRLPKPLYVPAGRTIVPQFQHFGQLADNLPVEISYSGRVLYRSQKPKNVCLPYVAGFKSKPMDAYGAADTDESLEVDLKNPFKHALNIDRFIGRTDYNITPNGTNNSVFEFKEAWEDVETYLMNIRMFDSKGEPTIPLSTPFGSIFPKSTRAWECPHVLDSQGYYKLFLEKLVPPGGASSDGSYVQTYVSMVGWHDVPLDAI